jgi:4-nitrophenyl phosphatase
MARRPLESPPVRTLSRIRGLMFDLDGTLLLSDRALGGSEVLPGAVEMLTELARRDFPFVVLTNGSAYPPAQQAAKLRGLGLPVPDDRMLTPSSVTAEVMRRHGVKRALILGSRGVGHALQDAGIEIVHTGEPRDREVQAVYVGWHPDCHMRDIEAACEAIWQGAKLYTASDVPFFASKGGKAMGYSYAIVGAIRRMTRAPMVITGKPSMHALSFVAKRLGVPRAAVGVIGDDPAVEMMMARRGGAVGMGVTTGVMDAAMWNAESGTRRPDWVLDRLTDLLPYLG